MRDALRPGGREKGGACLSSGIFALFNRAVELLNIEKDLIREAIASLASDQRIFIEEIEGQNHVYPQYLYVHETEVARMLRRLAHALFGFYA